MLNHVSPAPAYHVAQVNIAHLRTPLTDPMMSAFVGSVAQIDALAARAPGFVWQLQSPETPSIPFRVFDNDAIIVNLSVWESVEALYDFTYTGDHVAVFRRRRDWFHRMETPMLCLWWVAAGERPTLDDARAKLHYLHTHGATPLAFTFKRGFTVAQMLALA